MQKLKLLNFLLITTSLIGYLEWGGGNHLFLFQAEAEIIYKLFTEPTSVLHPFILLPLIAQILLMVTILQKQISKKLTYLGIGGLGILLGFMFLIGLISLNYKILFSTFPFLFITITSIIYYRRKTTN
jgi:hypothetical protein